MQTLTDFQGNFHYLVIQPVETTTAHVTYLARIRETGQLVMIRTLNPQAGYRLTPRLRREARILSTIDSQHIVKVHDIGKVNDSLFVVMDNIEGRPLMEWLDTQQQVDERTALRFLRQLAVALKAIDERNIVHQGLEPASVFVCPDPSGKEEGLLKIRDFGLAAERDHARVRLEELGSIAYLAPEQVDVGGYEIDIRTDIYSIGAIVFTVLTKRPPYVGRSAGDLVRQVSDLQVAPPPVIRLRPDLSEEAADIIMRCLENVPSRRYSSPRELIQEIEKIGVSRDPLEYLYEKAMTAQRADDFARVMRYWEKAQNYNGADIMFQGILKWAERRELEEQRVKAEVMVRDIRSYLNVNDMSAAQRTLEQLERLPDPTGQYEELRDEIRKLTEFKPAYLESSRARYHLVQMHMKVGRSAAKPNGVNGNGASADEHHDDMIDLKQEPDSRTVSRVHARLMLRDGTWQIAQNPKAANGTLLNGSPLVVGKAHRLTDGDYIQVGAVKLRFYEREKE